MSVKKIRISIEFALPEIQAGLSEEEYGFAEEARRLFPGRILNAVEKMLEEAGAEITLFQNQSAEDRILVP